ncbi:MAG: hypothetical protein KJ697_01820 [Nanoarchaeota archaeon]|nr:hypothetical protein [Nanoarchaeota archaeon]MBU4072422.1 hypothetical protein [Candidatus Thermoplasmatota archaeon]MBU4123850.1 hypothetical protein [Nanoarchaeota archaeon]
MAGKYNGAKLSFRSDENVEKILNNIMKTLGTESKSDAIRYALGMTDTTLSAVGSSPNIIEFRKFTGYLSQIKKAKENGNAVIVISQNYIDELKEKNISIIGEL